MAVFISFDEIFSEMKKELIRQGFKDERVPVDYTQLGFELHFQNSILETKVWYRQTTKSRKVEIKTS